MSRPDEEPEDLHGECAAEIHRLEAEVAKLTRQLDTVKQSVRSAEVCVTASWLGKDDQLYACQANISRVLIEQSVDPAIVIDHAVATIANYVKASLKYKP